VGTLEWQDDRENNELEIAEVFDLQHFGFAIPNTRLFQFRLRAHLIEMALRFAESKKRRGPWEMPFPCHLRHIVEIESPNLTLPRSLAQATTVEGRPFRFSCHVQQRPGFLSLTFELKVLMDHVTAAEYEDYKKRVREVWPHLIVGGQLTAGRSVPWGTRAPRHLLRQKMGRTPAKEASAPAVQPEANSQGTLVPTQVAPALAPAPAREKGTVVPRHGKSTRETEGPGNRERVVHRPNPVLQPAAGETSGQSERRRSRRSRRRQKRQLIMWISSGIGALILAGLLLILATAK
jgi:hypothetical protein